MDSENNDSGRSFLFVTGVCACTALPGPNCVCRQWQSKGRLTKYRSVSLGESLHGGSHWSAYQAHSTWPSNQAPAPACLMHLETNWCRGKDFRVSQQVMHWPWYHCVFMNRSLSDSTWIHENVTVSAQILLKHVFQCIFLELYEYRTYQEEQ